jgi:hypothetical protein
MKNIREIIIYLLFWLMTIAAAFQAGVIFELKGLDSAQKRIARLEANEREMSGKIESHVIILRGIAKGRAPQIP